MNICEASLSNSLPRLRVHHRRGGGRLNESQDGEAYREMMSSSRYGMDSPRITSQHL